MSMTPRDRVIAAMNKEKLDRPAVAIFTQSATLGQMDKVGAAWPEAHKNAEAMAKLAAAQADLFGYEAVRASFCLTAEAERLGCKVQVDKKDAAPMLKAHPFKFDPMMGEYDDPKTLMDPHTFVKEGRVKVVQDAVSILKKTHGKEYAVVAGNTGPFTLAGHLVSTENLVFGMMMAPEEVDKWVDATTPIVKAYTQALLDAGADVVQCSEPSASTDMLAPDMFEEAAGKAVKHSLAQCKGMTVLHICGDTYPILDQMAASGVTGLSVEEKVDPFKAMEKVAGKVAMVGNVGSVRPLFQGTPEEVKAAAIHSAKAGFNVISSGCGIAVATSDANMKAMVDAIKAYHH
jgi:[methyl-Co(III) methanol-specific corrinoid protein]:coenzyme M methyltransferase